MSVASILLKRLAINLFRVFLCICVSDKRAEMAAKYASRSIVVAFDPDLIIISGGLVEAGDFLLKPARGALERAASFSGHPLPRIVPAQLGNDAGLVGVADLARQ